MRNFQKQINSKVGSLTLLSFITDDNLKSRNPNVKVRCDCGSENEMSYGNFVHSKNYKGCFKCAKWATSKYQVGQRFDMLEIVGFDHNAKKERLAICRCDCGNIIGIRPSALPKNKSNHCGCARNGSYSGYEGLSGSFFGSIKTGAAKRGHSFNVTKKYLWNLLVKQEFKCALSDLEITLPEARRDGGTASLDRIDSSRGYERDNVQWVHKDLNWMKQDFTNEEFISYCKLVAETFPNDTVKTN